MYAFQNIITNNTNKKKINFTEKIRIINNIKKILVITDINGWNLLFSKFSF